MPGSLARPGPGGTSLYDRPDWSAPAWDVWAADVLLVVHVADVLDSDWCLVMRSRGSLLGWCLTRRLVTA